MEDKPRILSSIYFPVRRVDAQELRLVGWLAGTKAMGGKPYFLFCFPLPAFDFSFLPPFSPSSGVFPLPGVERRGGYTVTELQRWPAKIDHLLVRDAIALHCIALHCMPHM